MSLAQRGVTPLRQTANAARSRFDPAAVQVVEWHDAAQWNRFVAARDGGLFHRADWEQVFRCYRLPLYRLAAVRNEQLVGLLPLVHQKSLLFGNHLVSLPWFDAAGVLTDDDEARDALVQSAVELGNELRVDAVQLRHAKPFDFGRPVRSEKVLMRLKLESDPEVLWKRFPDKVRNQVRKSQKLGLIVERGGPELLHGFYAVYSTNMRDLGSPAHHRRFFEAVLDAFPAESRLYLVRLGNKSVGAGLTMFNGDRLEIPWASSLRDYNRLCVNHLMYWHILQDACEEGFAWFHFGRSSRDSGTYRFKKQWGAEALPLFWNYLTPDTTASVAMPRESYIWATRVWKRLPVWLARSVGPRLIANIP